VSGYYEWQDTPGGKQSWYFTARDRSPALTIAGVWDRWKNREMDEPLTSCVMIITEPNELVAEVHNRMPVLLAEKGFEPWLTGEAGIELLKPAPNDLLQKWPVSKRINGSRADDGDSTLIEQIELAAAPCLR
jgi:putative SOS response-associated peptidase YedK